MIITGLFHSTQFTTHIITVRNIEIGVMNRIGTSGFRIKKVIYSE